MDQHAFDSAESGRAFSARPGRKSGSKASIGLPVFEVVEAAFNVKRSELGAPTRGRRAVALARQTGMYLARVALSMTLSEAGRLFGRDRTTAAHACRLVEDLRDDPRFDAALTEMEAFIRGRGIRNRSASR